MAAYITVRSFAWRFGTEISVGDLCRRQLDGCGVRVASSGAEHCGHLDGFLFPLACATNAVYFLFSDSFDYRSVCSSPKGF